MLTTFAVYDPADLNSGDPVLIGKKLLRMLISQTQKLNHLSIRYFGLARFAQSAIAHVLGIRPKVHVASTLTRSIIAMVKNSEILRHRTALKRIANAVSEHLFLFPIDQPHHSSVTLFGKASLPRPAASKFWYFRRDRPIFVNMGPIAFLRKFSEFLSVYGRRFRNHSSVPFRSRPQLVNRWLDQLGQVQGGHLGFDRYARFPLGIADDAQCEHVRLRIIVRNQLLYCVSALFDRFIEVLRNLLAVCKFPLHSVSFVNCLPRSWPATAQGHLHLYYLVPDRAQHKSL